MTPLRALLAALFVLGLLPAVSGAAETADLADALSAAAGDSTPLDESNSSPNMTHVDTVTWDFSRRDAERSTPDIAGGTDLEFATIDGRTYAFTGTYSNGFQVIDVTDPEEASLVTTYECDVLQGDVQVFSRKDGELTRWFATYAVEGGASNAQDSQCFDDAGLRTNGTIIIEVTDPANPIARTVVQIPGGSHNQSVHPSGDYMYNSNSGGCGNCIEVFDISDLDDITEVARLPLTRDAHDVTFSADGLRAYAANVNHTAIINTEDPANPTVITVINDDAVTLHHQSDPFTVGGRDFLIINDELNGAGGNEVCPGGGLHIWDITDETAPEKVGAYFIPELTVREGAGTGTGGLVTCTSHVFRIYPEQQKMVIGWFGAGVRVLDLSGLAEAAVTVGAGALGTGPQMGITEVGYFRFNDSDSWAAKVPAWDDEGSAFIFSADQTRGLDVFHYDATAATAEDPGTWLTLTQAQQRLDALAAKGLLADTPRLICDLGFSRFAE